MNILEHTIIFFVFILVPVVFIHELGHFSMMRLFGAAVSRFSIGFGPILCSKKDSKGTRWCLSALPLGGYVMPCEEETEGVKGVPLDTLARWKRIIVLLAGPMANIILTIALTTSVYLVQGVPAGPATIIKIAENSPAQHAGLKPNDEILKINGHKISNALDAIFELKTNTNTNIEMLIKTETTQPHLINVKAIPHEDTSVDGRVMKNIFVGITMEKPKKIWPGVFATTTHATSVIISELRVTATSCWAMLTGHQSTSGMRGMVGLAQSNEYVAFSITAELAFAASVSLGLAFANLLPISTVLDGGKIFYLAIEMITKKTFTEKWKNRIDHFGYAIIMLLILLTTGQDLFYVAKPYLGVH